MTRLVLIVAMGKNGAIGRTVNGVGTLPWHLPEDLRHFREITAGKPVIMGRKTWESLPERFRPLPGRLNVVITRQAGYAAPGATVVDSVDAAVTACRGVPEAFVIGGAELYRQTIEHASALELTAIDLVVPDADAFFPEIDPRCWVETTRTRHLSTTGQLYAFVHMDRQGEAAPPAR